MIANELVEYCKSIGRECSDCPSFDECANYTELMRHAALLNISLDEDDDKSSS